MCQTFFFTLSKQDTRYTIHWEGAALESWSGGKNTNWIQIQFGYFGLWDTQPIQIYRLKRMLSSCQYDNTYEHQFSSVQWLSHVWLFVTPWTAARQTSLSISNSWSLLKLMSIESVMPSNHRILCRPLLLPSLIFSSIRVFLNESVLCIRWPEY